METALTPLDFARRARKLYAGLEGVIDEDSSSTYAQFFERCDRWSAALQHFGVRPGDRVAYIAPNTRAQLESFYAVPAIQEVAVVGVPDERWGEVPEAFVVLRSDASVSESELRNFAREAIAHFKVPHRFTFIEELPKTATGKIQKYMLRRGRPAISAV